jgi:uncharacterized protein YkwD
MKRLFITLLCLTLALPTPAFASSATVFRAINTARSNHGRSKLISSSRLSAVALQRANIMAQKQQLAHSFPGIPSTWDMLRAKKYTFSASGEIISANIADPKRNVRAWELSTSHRSILYSKKYNQMGVAQIQVKNGQKLSIITVVLFAYHPKNTP